MENNLACLVVTPENTCYYLNMDLVTGLTEALIIFWGFIMLFTIILRLMR